MPFVLELNSTESKPTHKDIVDALRQAIEDERLKPGDKMPSIRELAKSLAVSPALINRSYAELASQGYIKTVHGRGAYLSDRIPYIRSLPVWQPPAHMESEEPFPVSAYGEQLLAETFLQQSPLLHSSAPLVEDLPVSRWRTLLHNAVRFEDPALLAYEGDPMGYWPLRKAISDYLLRSRSVKCTAEQVAVFPQVEGGKDVIVRILMRPGDVAVVEDPCYQARRLTFRLHGVKVIGIPVDEHGLKVERLHELAEKPRIVHVVPSHHDPTGVAMSLQRRHDLLSWAHDNDAFVIENDFDCEYNYGAPYLPSMQGMDEHDLVIYRYTFWRVLYPLIRMSILVVPHRLIPYVRRAQQFLGETPLLEQKALAEFLTAGHFERHIQHTRTVYEARRIALIQSLTKHFGKLKFSTAGMHLLLTFPEEYSPEAILYAGVESGLTIAQSTSYYYQLEPPKNEFLIGFAYIASEDAIRDAVDQFAECLMGSG